MTFAAPDHHNEIVPPMARALLLQFEGALYHVCARHNRRDGGSSRATAGFTASHGIEVALETAETYI